MLRKSACCAAVFDFSPIQLGLTQKQCDCARRFFDVQGKLSPPILPRGVLRRQFDRTRRLHSDILSTLSRLAPQLGLQPGANLSAAALIAKTAFEPRRNDASSKDVSWLHSLACEHMNTALYLCSFCGEAQKEEGNDAYEFDKNELTRMLTQYASAHSVGGWTLAVWNPTVSSGTSVGRIEVINVGETVSPIDVDLWPLLCLNVLDRAWMTSERDGGADTASASVDHPPSWSRRSRAHVAADTTPQLQGTSFDEQRSTYIKRMVEGHVNWQFAVEQLRAAKQWYSSKEYEHQKEAKKKAREQKAIIDALQQYRNLQSDSDLVSPATTSQPAAESASKHDESNVAAESTKSVSEAQPSPASSTGASRSEGAVPRKRGGVLCADGSLLFEYPDGRKEYTRPDSSKVVVYPDGTCVFHAKDVVTTQKTDGRVIFEYPDGSSITQHPDGTTTTKYADGTTDTKSGQTK